MVWFVAIVLWPILGFVAFRIALVMSGGVKREVGFSGKVYYKPSDGLRYMAFGAFAFVVIFLLLCLSLIVLAVNSIYDFITGINFNSNYSINRFFGTDKEHS